MRLKVKFLMSFAACAVPILASSSSSSSNSKMQNKAKQELESSSSSSSSSASSAAAAVVSANSTQIMHAMFREKRMQDQWVLDTFRRGNSDALQQVLECGANVNFASQVLYAGYADTVLNGIPKWSKPEIKRNLEILFSFNVDPFIRKPDGTIVCFACEQLDPSENAAYAFKMLKDYSLKFCKKKNLLDKYKELTELHYKKHSSKK